MEKSFLKAITIIVLTIICSTGYAQENYLKGYIINLKGDSVHGFIDYSNFGMNPDNVIFKTGTDAQAKAYQPLDILEFGVNNEIYEGGIIEVECSSRDMSNLNDRAGLYIEIDTSFIKAIVKGKKGLYVYEKGLFPNFYIKGDTSFQLLVYKKYLKEGKDITAVVENKKYQGQLINYLSDCPRINSITKGIKYNKNSLERVFRSYYQCIHSNDYLLPVPIKNININLGVTAGISMTSFNFSVYNFEKSANTKFVNYPIGLSLDISRPIGLRKWAFYNEFLYTSPYEMRSDVYIDEGEWVSKTSTILSMHSFKLVDMMRYQYRLNKFTYFASAGLSTEFYKGTRTVSSHSTVLGTKVDKSTSEKRNYRAQRIATGLGVKFHKLSFEVRYESPNPMRNVGSSTSFLLNLTF